MRIAENSARRWGGNILIYNRGIVKRVLTIGVAGLLLAATVMAQAKTLPPSVNLGNTAVSPTASRGPILITGKVLLDNGKPPGLDARAEIVCNKALLASLTLDGKGTFSTVIHGEPNSGADASLEGPSASSRFDLDLCELRARLSGYRSDVIRLTKIRYLENTDVGTIVLHRISGIEGTTVSATSDSAPKPAREAYERGVEFAQKGNAKEARKAFEKAVAIYPEYAVAWLRLGALNEKSLQITDARAAYHKAVIADPKFATPYASLAALALKESNWQELAGDSDKAIELDPDDFPDAYYFSAVAHFQLGQLDIAEKSGRQAVARNLDEHNPRAHYVLGLILAQKGNPADGAEQLRAFLKVAPTVADADRIRQQQQEMEQAANRGPR